MAMSLLWNTACLTRDAATPETDMHPNRDNGRGVTQMPQGHDGAEKDGCGRGTAQAWGRATQRDTELSTTAEAGTPQAGRQGHCPPQLSTKPTWSCPDAKAHTGPQQGNRRHKCLACRRGQACGNVSSSGGGARAGGQLGPCAERAGHKWPGCRWMVLLPPEGCRPFCPSGPLSSLDSSNSLRHWLLPDLDSPQPGATSPAQRRPSCAKPQQTDTPR